MRKKLGKVTALTLALCMSLGCTGVFAANQPLKFNFTAKEQKRQRDNYAKEDNEQNAYVTLKDTNYSNFLPGDVFGCRVRKASNNAAVTNYTLIKKIKKYKLPYTAKGYKNTKYHLVGQIDSSGDYSSLKVQGVWLP